MTSEALSSRTMLTSLVLAGILILSPTAPPAHTAQAVGHPNPCDGLGPLAVAVSINATGAQYVLVGDYPGTTVSITNCWIGTLSLVIYATFRSGTSIYIAGGSATIAANVSTSVFCIDVLPIPQGQYEVTFAAVTLSNQAVSAPTTPVNLVVPTARGSAPTLSSVALANTTLTGFPSDIAIDLNTSRIFVSDLFANKITVLSSANYSVIDTIALPATPEGGMALDTKTDILYVPVFGCTNEVNVPNSCVSGAPPLLKPGIVEIDGATNTIIQEIPIDAQLLAVDPSTGMLYGLSPPNFSPLGVSSQNNLLAIDAQTGSLVANLSLNAVLLSVAVDTKTDAVYVAACQAIPLPCEGAELFMINGSTNKLQDAVSLPFDVLNFPVVIDSDTGMVYAMGSTGNNLTLFAVSGSSGAIEYSTILGGSCGGGGELALNAQGNELYVAFDSQNPFLAIDAGTGQVTSMVSTQRSIQAVAYNPGTNQIYVTAYPQRANGTEGYLAVLPGSTGGSYVNYGLLASNACYP